MTIKPAGLLAAGLAALAIAAPGVAHAESSQNQSGSAAAAAACKWRVKKAPYKKGSTVRKKYIIRNCPGSFSYHLQRHRWWGWQVIKETRRLSGNHTGVLKKSCKGEGTYTYRVVSKAFIGGRILDIHQSNTRRFSC